MTNCPKNKNAVTCTVYDMRGDYFILFFLFEDVHKDDYIAKKSHIKTYNKTRRHTQYIYKNAHYNKSILNVEAYQYDD